MAKRNRKGSRKLCAICTRAQSTRSCHPSLFPCFPRWPYHAACQYSPTQANIGCHPCLEYIYDQAAGSLPGSSEAGDSSGQRDPRKARRRTATATLVACTEIASRQRYEFVIHKMMRRQRREMKRVEKMNSMSRSRANINVMQKTIEESIPFALSSSRYQVPCFNTLLIPPLKYPQ